MKRLLASLLSLAALSCFVAPPSTADAATTFYTPTKKVILDGGINFDTDTIKVVLIDSADYTVSAAHDFYNDVAAAARVCTATTIANTTTTGGVFDGDDVTYTSCSGDQSEAYIVFKDTGVETTSNLIVYVDSAASGLPVTPNGGNITIAWHATDGVFKLGRWGPFESEHEALATITQWNPDQELWLEAGFSADFLAVFS